MKSHLVTFLVGLTAMLLSQSASAQQEFEKLIVGKWEVNIERTKEYCKERSIEIPNEELLGGSSALSLEFGNDKSVTVREGDTEAMRGEWKFVKDEDGVFHVELIRDEEATPATIEFLNNQTIAVSPQNEQPLVLTRSDSKPLEPLAAKLVGAWKQDPDATKALELNKSFSQEDIDRMLLDTNEMEIELLADKTMVAKLKGEVVTEIKAYWVVSEIDEAKQSMRIDFSGDDVERSVQAVFLDVNLLCLTPEGEPSAAFKRVAATKDQ